MVVLLTGQHSCGILTHRINGGAADGSAFLWNTNPQDNFFMPPGRQTAAQQKYPQVIRCANDIICPTELLATCPCGRENSKEASGSVPWSSEQLTSVVSIECFQYFCSKLTNKERRKGHIIHHKKLPQEL